MNHHEVRIEFMRDLKIIGETTLQRLLGEYHRERKKFRIDPTRKYAKTWAIKTKSKNNWLIFIRKSPSVAKYRNTDDLAYCCASYYYDKQGLCVLRYFKEMDMIEAFWGHLLTRYKERMRLDISSTVELIKHFINHSGYIHHLIYPTIMGKRNIGICKEGFVFGEVQNEGTWLVNKTFISKDLAFNSQNQLEAQMIQILQQDVLRDWASPNFNDIDYQKKNDMLLSLRA